MSKLFYLVYTKLQKHCFQHILLNQYLSHVKSLFEDDSKAEQTAFSMERISISLKLLSGHFYGQCCIKTV